MHSDLISYSGVDKGLGHLQLLIVTISSITPNNTKEGILEDASMLFLLRSSALTLTVAAKPENGSYDVITIYLNQLKAYPNICGLVT
jgi:hypothetical protein